MNVEENSSNFFLQNQPAQRISVLSHSSFHHFNENLTIHHATHKACIPFTVLNPAIIWQQQLLAILTHNSNKSDCGALLFQSVFLLGNALGCVNF